MKDKNFIIKIVQLLIVIPLYYIAGKNSMFLYVLTISLYNIYSSCYSHITIEEHLKKTKHEYSKFQILKYTTINIILFSLLFVIINILLSDTINIFLNIENIFLPTLTMSISLISEPLIKLFLEYLESYNKPKLSNRLLKTYYILEMILLLIISILTIRVFKLPMHISIAIMYSSKIISLILVTTIILIVLNKQNINFDKQPEENNISYKKQIKTILTNNHHKSIINIIKNSYYYISIIILYMILQTRYSYNIELIENNITFIYLYGLSLIQCIGNIILQLMKYLEKNKNIINYILKTFKYMINTAIILGITSPLVCKIIYADNSNSIYLMMLSFLLMFISLFDLTFDNIKNTKIIYTSLIVGIISKLILIVPLINSFYRMGYNLIYGDIISTMISMLVSFVINYIYLKNKNKKEKTFEKIMTILYESLMLCIILVILQFIIPITTSSYFVSILIFIVYITISIGFIILKKKRG